MRTKPCRLRRVRAGVLRLHLEVLAGEFEIHGQPVRPVEFDNEWLSSCVTLQGAAIDVGVAHVPRHGVAQPNVVRPANATKHEREPHHV